jgi:hypothetical protein
MEMINFCDFELLFVRAGFLGLREISVDKHLRFCYSQKAQLNTVEVFRRPVFSSGKTLKGGCRSD